MTSQTINLDLIPKGVPPIIHASQYDKGQTWTFVLYKDGTEFSIPTGTTITIQGTKSDSTGFQYACTWSGSEVTATEEQQMTIYAGDVATELVLVNDDAQIATLNFIIRVEPAALSDDTVISDTELPLIEEAAELAENIEEYITEISGYASDSEAYAVGTRDGEAVEEGDVAYENNSKYYAENCIGYVTDTQYSTLETLFS